NVQKEKIYAIFSTIDAAAGLTAGGLPADYPAGSESPVRPDPKCDECRAAGDFQERHDYGLGEQSGRPTGQTPRWHEWLGLPNRRPDHTDQRPEMCGPQLAADFRQTV